MIEEIINKNNEIKFENNSKKSFILKIKENSNLYLFSYIEDSNDNINYLGNAFIPPFSYYIEFVNKSFLDKYYKGD